MSKTGKIKKEKTRELTGRHVSLMLIAFFGVTVGVNAIFITKAVSSFTGEDVKGSYRQGIEYNKTIESRSQQATLGWTVKTNIIQSETGTQRFIIAMTDASGAPVSNASISGIFKRPTDLAKDRDVAFTARGKGVYESTLNLPKGQWMLKATASSQDQNFRFEDRFVIKP